MTRLNVVLLLAVLASALYLVRTQYESRRLFVELEKAQATTRKIDIDRDRLEVEKRAESTSLRVEKLAKTQLQMRGATPAVTQYVRVAQLDQPASAAVPATATRTRP